MSKSVWLFLIGAGLATLVWFFSCGPGPDDAELQHIRDQRDSLLKSGTALRDTVQHTRDSLTVVLRQVKDEVAQNKALHAQVADLHTRGDSLTKALAGAASPRDTINTLLSLAEVQQQEIQHTAKLLAMAEDERDVALAVGDSLLGVTARLQSRVDSLTANLGDTRQLERPCRHPVPLLGGCIGFAVGVGPTTPLFEPGKDVEVRLFAGGVYRP